jgi:hypothetical protein
VKIKLSKDWTEFLSLLIARRVRFVVVGGHAVAGHGEPRLTEDLDVFVEPGLSNARKLRAALVAFGYELAVPDKIFMLGRKPWRIDILTGIDGVTFARAWASRVKVDLGRSSLPVIGRGLRPKDLLDVELLERHRPKPRRRRSRG